MVSPQWAKRAFSSFFLAISVIIGLLAANASEHQLWLASLLKFFEFMIPVLIVGALLKYLFDFKH